MSKTVEKTTSQSNEGFFEPFNIDAVPWRRLPGTTAFKLLGRFGGGSQVGVGIDVLKPNSIRIASTITWPRKSTCSS